MSYSEKFPFPLPTTQVRPSDGSSIEEQATWNAHIWATRKAAIGKTVDNLTAVMKIDGRKLSDTEEICLILGVMFLCGDLSTKEKENALTLLGIFP